MQKWRPWETANEVEWGLAVEGICDPSAHLLRRKKLTHSTIPAQARTVAVSPFRRTSKELQRGNERMRIASVFDLSVRMPCSNDLEDDCN